jgi:hypothetical protein
LTVPGALARGFLAPSVLLAACSLGGSNGSTPTSTAAVAAVTVTPSPATVPAGLSLQLSALTTDANGNVLTGRVVEWASGNETIATVARTGLVTGVAVGGPVTVTATSEGKSGVASVTVTPLPMATVTLVSATPASGATIHATDFTNIPVTLKITITSPFDVAGEVFSGFQSGRPPGCLIVLATPVSVALFANQPQDITLGPFKFVTSVGAIAKSIDCPLPFTVTSVTYEFSNPALFNTGTSLTYNFVP